MNLPTTATYRGDLFVRSNGVLVNADATPAVSVEVNGAAAGSQPAVTVANPSTGRYRYSFALAQFVDGDAVKPIATAAVGGVAVIGAGELCVVGPSLGTNAADSPNAVAAQAKLTLLALDANGKPLVAPQPARDAMSLPGSNGTPPIDGQLGVVLADAGNDRSHFKSSVPLQVNQIGAWTGGANGFAVPFQVTAYNGTSQIATVQGMDAQPMANAITQGDTFVLAGAMESNEVNAPLAYVKAQVALAVDQQLTATHQAGPWNNAPATVGGTLAVSVSVVDAGNVPVAAAVVRLQSTTVQTPAVPVDGSGLAAFVLNPGAWSILATAPGYYAAPKAVTADANDTQFSITMAVVSITPPSDPAQTTAYLITYDGSGAKLANVEIEFRYADAGTVGQSFPQRPFSAFSDGSALLQQRLPINTAMQARRDGGDWVSFTTGSGPTCELPAVLGKQGD